MRNRVSPYWLGLHSSPKRAPVRFWPDDARVRRIDVTKAKAHAIYVAAFASSQSIEVICHSVGGEVAVAASVVGGDGFNLCNWRRNAGRHPVVIHRETARLSRPARVP